MAHIRKRTTKSGEPRYQVQVRKAGAPPITKTFRNLAAAKAWARDIETELDRGHLLPQIEADKHTVAKAISRYKRTQLERVSARHADHRRVQLAWWVDRIGHVKLSKVVPALLVECREALLISRSAQTVNHYMAALSTVLDTAVREWAWMGNNPVAKLKPLPLPAGRVRFLSDKERNALLTACRESADPRLYPLVLFSLATGARQTELMRLKWSDINLGHEPPRATIHKTKNRDRRVLSFPGEAGAVLRGLAQVQHISGWVWATPLTTGRPRFPAKFWRLALEASGVEDFRWHDLRHTAASYLAMSGATLAELAAFLGHRSLASVQRYAHLAEHHSEGVAARMVERFLS